MKKFIILLLLFTNISFSCKADEQLLTIWQDTYSQYKSSLDNFIQRLQDLSQELGSLEKFSTKQKQGFLTILKNATQIRKEANKNIKSMEFFIATVKGEKIANIKVENVNELLIIEGSKNISRGLTAFLEDIDPVEDLTLKQQDYFQNFSEALELFEKTSYESSSLIKKFLVQSKSIMALKEHDEIKQSLIKYYKDMRKPLDPAQTQLKNILRVKNLIQSFSMKWKGPYLKNYFMTNDTFIIKSPILGSLAVIRANDEAWSYYNSPHSQCNKTNNCYTYTCFLELNTATIKHIDKTLDRIESPSTGKVRFSNNFQVCIKGDPAPKLAEQK